MMNYGFRVISKKPNDNRYKSDVTTTKEGRNNIIENLIINGFEVFSAGYGII